MGKKKGETKTEVKKSKGPKPSQFLRKLRRVAKSSGHQAAVLYSDKVMRDKLKDLMPERQTQETLDRAKSRQTKMQQRREDRKGLPRLVRARRNKQISNLMGRLSRLQKAIDAKMLEQQSAVIQNANVLTDEEKVSMPDPRPLVEEQDYVKRKLMRLGVDLNEPKESKAA